MRRSSDINLVFEAWRQTAGRQREWALYDLMKEMARFAETICWLRLPDHKSEIDELVNGIVWRAVNALDKFKAESKFSTWFYRIVVNECNTFLRNYKEKFEVELTEDLSSEAEGLDARIDLVAMLDKLQGADHLLLRLVIEGQDFNAIGQELGISRNTALQRWNRLKEKLRDAI